MSFILYYNMYPTFVPHCTPPKSHFYTPNEEKRGNLEEKRGNLGKLRGICKLSWGYTSKNALFLPKYGLF